MTNDSKIPLTSHHRIEADGVHVFYGEAGPANAPVILLLHGFPTSSFQYRELSPRLADRYRVIAPDLPGFGFTEIPAERSYKYTFDALAKNDLRLHGGSQTQPLRDVRIRLRSAHWLSPGVNGSGTRDRHCVSEWQRV
jgi:pimeloyl-ACP methyl ester carboxylesterase